MLKKIISFAESRNFIKTALLIALRFFSIGIGFIFIKVYTNALTTDQIGKYFYLITLSYVMNAVVFVPVDYYFQSRLAFSGKDVPLGAVWKLNKAVCLLAFVICMAVGLPLLYLDKIGASDIFGIYITAFSLYVCNLFRGLLNNGGHKIFVVSMLVLEGALKLGLFIASAAMITAGAELLLYSSVIAMLLEMLVIGIYFSRRVPYNLCREGLDDYRTVFRQSYAISVSAVCSLAQLQFYRLMYVWAGATTTAAVYTVVMNLGSSGMNAISSVYSQIFLPRIYASKGKYTLIYIRNALLLGLVSLIGAAIFGKYLLMLLTKEDYVRYAQAMGFGVLIETGNAVIGAITVFLMLRNASRLMIFYNVFAAVASMAGGFVVMSLWPENVFLVGVPIVVSQIFIAAFLVWRVKKMDKQF